MPNNSQVSEPTTPMSEGPMRRNYDRAVSFQKTVLVATTIALGTFSTEPVFQISRANVDKNYQGGIQ